MGTFAFVRRVLGLWRSRRYRPASEIVDEIVRRLNEFRWGGRREDDVTLVVARVLPFDRAGGNDAPWRLEVQE